MASDSAVGFVVGVITAVVLVCGVIYLIHRSSLCDDGKPHDWDLWNKVREHSIDGTLMRRSCNKCGWIEDRWV